MDSTLKKSFLGSAIAFVIGTACCWLPWIALLIGGATGIAGITSGLEKLSGVFLGIGILLLGYGVYQLRNKRLKGDEMKQAILKSIIRCPECGYEQEETMPTDSCQFFYKCSNCEATLKAKEGDCCVYCSYGTVPCPPIQFEKECC